MKIRSKFHHLTEKDRDRLHVLHLEGHAQKDMAEVLGVSPSAVSRELARYGRTTWRYNAIRAQADADLKRGNSKRPGMKIEACPELKRHIVKQLRRLRSPDEIAGRLKKVNHHSRLALMPYTNGSTVRRVKSTPNFSAPVAPERSGRAD